MALAAEALLGGKVIGGRSTKPHLVVPYRGYGTTETIRVMARVIRDPSITRGLKPATSLGNLRDTWRRVSSAEVPGAVVEIAAGSATLRVRSDDEGYIDAELPCPPERHGPWVPVRLTLLEPQPPQETVSFAECLVPDPSAEFGVISDIDDTIVKTGAASYIRMFRSVVFHNARTRTPFEHVGDFYLELSHGSSSTRPVNPLFYVSSGPWNFYDVLDDFLLLNRIPQGPILLQDYGLDDEKLIHADHHAHKLEQIEGIFGTYPHLPFVLIGDSGQADPEIYESVVRAHPDRVRAIFIRDVSHAVRDEEVRSLGEATRSLGVELHLVPTTEQARNLAERDGLIRRRGQ